MIIDIFEQLDLFLTSIMLGVITAIFFDFFRIIRKVFIHKRYFVYLEDLFFWILSTFVFYYVFLHKNNGEIRIYMVFGYICATICFWCTISPFLVKYGSWLLLVVVKFFKGILNLLLKPFEKLCTMVSNSCNVIKNKKTNKDKERAD
ncbi:MAG: spore cortex biosynthesis protein YabQ [Lachnospirales bacterium]